MTKKNWYEIWSVWLIVIMVSFAIIEGTAIATGGVTLSRYTWDLTLAWPLIPVVYGGVFIGLAVHFWWHWNPPGSDSRG
jgi:hypothetical protein